LVSGAPAPLVIVMLPPLTRAAASAAIKSQACSWVLVSSALANSSAMRSMTAVSRGRAPASPAAKASAAAASRRSLP